MTCSVVREAVKEEKTMSIFPRGRRGDGANNHFAAVQRALAAAAGPDFGAFFPAVHAMVEEKQWQQRSFPSFSECAVAPQPDGLQIWTTAAAKLIRRGLLETMHYPEWVELLDKIKRPSGAPSRIFAQGEGYFRFYKISTSSSAIDRLLPVLSSGAHQQEYEDVCAGRLSVREAAVKAGVLPLDWAARHMLDFTRFDRWSPEVQAKRLAELFRRASLEGQCLFLTHELASLGLELADVWRRLHQSRIEHD
jgi:hypothetical protein